MIAEKTTTKNYFFVKNRIKIQKIFDKKFKMMKIYIKDSDSYAIKHRKHYPTKFLD